MSPALAPATVEGDGYDADSPPAALEAREAVASEAQELNVPAADAPADATAGDPQAASADDDLAAEEGEADARPGVWGTY